MILFGRYKLCKENHLMDPSWKACPVCIAPIVGWLVVISENHKNNIFSIHEGNAKIGSGLDCEIRINHDNIARQQALITTKDGMYKISDLFSEIGVYVNNMRITSRDIIDGDIIRLGETEFKFKCL